MTILVVGYYGYGNAGDEFLLQQTTQFLADSIPREPIVWFSKFKTIVYIPRASFIVFGGGGLLQNKSSQRSLYYYISLIFLAKLCRKPIVLLSQGIGPIYGVWANRLTGYALSCCSFISVRDVVSYQLAIPYQPKTIQSIDLAFYKQTMSQKYVSSKVEMSDDASIFINIRSGEEWDAYRHVLEPVFDSLAYKTYVIAHAGVDVSLSNLSPPLDLMDLFCQEDHVSRGSVKSMMSMRYHGCVWAIINQIPCLALAYDEKVVQLAAQFNLPILDLRQTYSSDHVMHVVTEFLENSSGDQPGKGPIKDLDRHFTDIQSLYLNEVLEL